MWRRTSKAAIDACTSPERALRRVLTNPFCNRGSLNGRFVGATWPSPQFPPCYAPDRRSNGEVGETLLQQLELGCLRASEKLAFELGLDLDPAISPKLDAVGKPNCSPAPRGLTARDDGHLELCLVLGRK